MSGAGAGRSHNAVGWAGHNHGWFAARAARRLATRQVLEATEADLTERGILIPPKPMSQASMFWAGFFVGLLLGLLIGGVVWELT